MMTTSEESRQIGSGDTVTLWGCWRPNQQHCSQFVTYELVGPMIILEYMLEIEKFDVKIRDIDATRLFSVTNISFNYEQAYRTAKDHHDAQYHLGLFLFLVHELDPLPILPYTHVHQTMYKYFCAVETCFGKQPEQQHY